MFPNLLARWLAINDGIAVSRFGAFLLRADCVRAQRDALLRRIAAEHNATRGLTTEALELVALHEEPADRMEALAMQAERARVDFYEEMLKAVS